MIARTGLAVLVAGLALAGSAAGRQELHPQVTALSWAPTAAITFGAVGGGTYAVNADGTGLHRLTRLGGDVAPQLSPDGRTVLIGDGSSIFAVTSDGRARRVARGFSPVWSPRRQTDWASSRTKRRSCSSREPTEQEPST